MPIYEYQCANGHITELLFNSFEESPSVTVCMFSDRYSGSSLCRCSADRIVSLPIMKPDSHWSGTTTPTGDVVYSQKEYDAVMKNIVPATRDNKEFVEKQAVLRKQEHEEKKAQRRDKFFDNLARDL